MPDSGAVGLPGVKSLSKHRQPTCSAAHAVAICTAQGIVPCSLPASSQSLRSRFITQNSFLFSELDFTDVGAAECM